ncbi:MAG: hypothetical protein K2J15_02735 [Muribaculaceae bacterium]|nr:hypothetical protein [Muribaculaceae bacterium]
MTDYPEEMRKINLILTMTLSVMVLTLAGGCSEADAPKADVSNMDGTRVTSVGECKIRYDEKGRAYRFKDAYDEIEIDYDENKMRIDDQEYNLKFNGNGFITEMSFSFNESDEDYEDKGSGKFSFSYDKDHCLKTIKEEISGTIKDYETNTVRKVSYKSEEKFTWKKGNLKQIVYNCVEDEAGEKYYENTNIEIEYSFDENVFRQFPLRLNYESEGDYDILFAVGLFGNGPVDLPEKMIIEEESDGDISTRERTFSFRLNENGTINTVTCNGSSVSYGYSNITKSDGSIDLYRIRSHHGNKLSGRLRRHLKK